MPPRPNEDRREELLDQLQELITQEGFAHLRVGELAARLRCSRSTLYKLAPSKDDLVALLFQRIIDRIIADAALQATKSTDPADKIMRFSDEVDRWQSSFNPQFWRDVNATPRVADLLSQGRARGYLFIRGYLDEGIACGEFREANTAFAAHLVWLGAAATRDPDLLERLGVDRKTASHELAQLILYGMGRGVTLSVPVSEPKDRS